MYSNPYHVSYVSAARDPLQSQPYGCQLVRFHPVILPWERRYPSRLKAWVFLITYRGL